MKNSIFKILGIVLFFGFLIMAKQMSTKKSADPGNNNVIGASMAVEMPAVVVSNATFNTDSVDKAVKNVNKKDIKTIRACVKNYLTANIGNREKTNKNDGVWVEKYFKNIGWGNVKNLKPHQKYYCGAFVGSSWLNCVDSVRFVKNRKELAQVRKWEKGPHIDKRDASVGDAVTLKAYSHVEAVYDVHPNPTFKFVTIVGGNTSPDRSDKDRRGGVFKKERLWLDIKSVISLQKSMIIKLG